MYLMEKNYQVNITVNLVIICYYTKPNSTRSVKPTSYH